MQKSHRATATMFAGRRRSIPVSHRARTGRNNSEPGHQRTENGRTAKINEVGRVAHGGEIIHYGRLALQYRDELRFKEG
jgi:hypothetical protein